MQPPNLPPGPRAVSTPVRPRVLLGTLKRGLLVLAALAMATVLFLATRIHPYDGDGKPLSMGSHRQLGLPACSFVEMTGKPCPSCGMTTSFALLMAGDVVNSMRANFVGTFLAVFCIAAIPWSLVATWKGRYPGLRGIERPLLILVGALTLLMVGRWGIVLLADR